MSATIEERPRTNAFALRKLSPTFGAEIVGLDLSRPLDDDTKRAVYDAFVAHHVICFRGQSLDMDQQVAFSEQFGALERHTLRNRGAGKHPLVHTVSNLGLDGLPSGKVGSQTWHSDKSFRPEPSMATILHAVTLPPDGGDTCFADMSAAFEALPADRQAALERERVVHSWELSLAKTGKKGSAEEIADAPPMAHPLVRRHPDTGRKALFMGEHASHFEGRPMAYGRAALAELEAHATQERFQYRHDWQPGDVLMWDNRCLLHRADANFDAARYPRVLHRTCLRGTAP